MTLPLDTAPTAAGGSAVFRSHVVRLRLIAAAGVAFVIVAVLVGIIGRQAAQLHVADANVERLSRQRAAQQLRLDVLERQAQALQRLNAESQRTIDQIEHTLGQQHASARRFSAARAAAAGPAKLDHDAALVALAARLRSLAAAASATRARTAELAGVARRVLNLRRLAAIARSRMIAAIPSLNPVNGAVNAAFGWRTDPWPEFHKGLDLAADYGTVVHAAASGTVVSASWEGGFGIKVDIDHHNGYHTWYCHLARSDVRPGQPVVRGEPIAIVGTTGESTGPHLHYQVMHDGVAIDPLPFLSGVPPNVMATLPQNPRVQ
jgi:murein DD-endopeptidase MepM/ murein hydrolase activator NlpD